MTEDIELLYYEKCEQINRFDILVSDPYTNDDFHIIEGSYYLTLQEVWEWLCEGGDWNFKVMAAKADGHSDKCFLSGKTYHDNRLRDAVDGRTLLHLCFANEDEAAEVEAKAKARIKKEMDDEQNGVL